MYWILLILSPNSLVSVHPTPLYPSTLIQIYIFFCLVYGYNMETGLSISVFFPSLSIPGVPLKMFFLNSASDFILSHTKSLPGWFLYFERCIGFNDLGPASSSIWKQWAHFTPKHLVSFSLCLCLLSENCSLSRVHWYFKYHFLWESLLVHSGCCTKNTIDWAA